MGAGDWGGPHLTTHPWVGVDPQPVRGPHCAPLSVSSWSVWGGDWRDSRRSNCPTLRTPAGNGRPRRAAEISRRQAARQCWPPAIPGRDPAIRSVADDMVPERQGRLSPRSEPSNPPSLSYWLDGCGRMPTAIMRSARRRNGRARRPYSRVRREPRAHHEMVRAKGIGSRRDERW